ncbi:hypothetical protein E4U43_004745 [Claviceps pusilla]|uniref:Uncharacterized protein n=1 Tax=Claviceps pusilla TaxID=123648 RepID=A0A9P7N305_9HYPO|nr:hypothetical protein E4U43_004745 [Claviceps pusilla]
MSLTRAFTTRRLRGSSDAVEPDKMVPQRHRSHSIKTPHDIRNKISAPIQLLHTTNMLSYNAPDIPRPVRSNSTHSGMSQTDADAPSAVDSTPPTSPDVDSSPGPNHLSCYFKASGSPFVAATPSETEAPAIPRRSPSHTKQNSHDAIARQRSASRASRDSDQSSSMRGCQTFSRSPSTSTRASSASHASNPFSQKLASASPIPPTPSVPYTISPQAQAKETHPFGHELAQVTELAEEYTIKTQLNVIDEEEQYLFNHGLQKVSPDDYTSAIQSISAMFFPERRHAAPAAPPLWI